MKLFSSGTTIANINESPLMVIDIHFRLTHVKLLVLVHFNL